MELDPVAIELNLVQPAGAARHLLDGRCQRSFDEAGKFALVPIEADFLRWDAIVIIN